MSWTVEGAPGCGVSPAVVNDVDRFAAELQAWPQARLRACNYMVGWIDGDTTRARTATSMDGFQKIVSDVANRALRRYPRADGIPADVLVKVKYHFDIETDRR